MSVLNNFPSLFDYTIWNAIDNTCIQQCSKESQNLDWQGKIRIGIIAAVRGLGQTFVLRNVLAPLTKIVFDDIHPIIKHDFIGKVVISPVIEEIVFRYILHNCIWLTQETAKKQMPSCIKNTQVFEWLISPSARILGGNCAFAFAYLLYIGRHDSAFKTFRHLTIIFLLPRYAILYEETNSMVSPIVCHMVNNFIFSLVLSLVGVVH